MTDYDYCKSKRLLKSIQFKTVFDTPIFKVHDTHLMAFVSDTQQSEARLGMAITKKKVPTAVMRNQIKRLIRERFRGLHSLMPNLDIVFIVKKSPKALSNQQLNDEITSILNKIVKKANR